MNDTLSTAPAAIVAIAGTAYAAINDVAILQDVLIGVALGTLIAKLVVRRLERRSAASCPPLVCARSKRPGSSAASAPRWCSTPSSR